MDYVLNYDYAALYINLVLLTSIIMAGHRKDRVSRRSIVLIAISIISCVLDIGTVTLDRSGSGNIVIKHMINGGFILISNLMTPIYVWYVSSFTSLFRRVKFKYIVIGVWPVAFVVILLIVNLFTGCIFYINEAGQYTRGQLFWLLYIGVAYYVIFNFVHIFKRRKIFGLTRVLALIFFIGMVMVSVGIQFIHPEMLVQLFTSSLATMLVVNVVQRPEATLDADTGIKNSKSFMKNLNIVGYHKAEEEIIIINVGNYNAFIDMLGMTKSLELMRELAYKLQYGKRDAYLEYTVYYLRRGQFRVVLRQHDLRKAEELASYFNHMMKKPVSFEEMTLYYNACVCIARYPNDASDPDAMIELGRDVGPDMSSGELLYADKIFVKDKYNLSREIDVIIQNALVNHKFEVYYQPIYSVKEDRFISAEALLRLKDDKYGFVSPEIFIPAAERSGAIHAIGEYVIEQVCEFIGSEEFKRIGVDYIEVNLSVAQCMRQNLAAEIMTIIHKHNVSVDQLNLEITETAASYSQDMLIENMMKLAKEGIKFSLDDYGTGYSNIQRIAAMPFSIIKLDKTFVNAQLTGKMRTILDNTIRMFKAMNMELVVEGIETKDNLNLFASLGCDFIQGYYFSKPIPRENFINFVTTYDPANQR